jgi:Tol biopolymer transport system component
MQGNQSSSSPSISSDGRFVAFGSDGDNLVSGDTNVSEDIFVHDRQTGQTSRVSVSSTGVQGEDHSFDPSISSDGQFVAFESTAHNLMPGELYSSLDVVVHDRQTSQTKKANVFSTNEQTYIDSSSPSISSDGRYVAFESSALTNVDGGLKFVGDIFVHDRQTGQTSRVSVSSTGIRGNGWSSSPSISSDGRFVAFGSDSDNLVSGDTNISEDIFVHDRLLESAERNLPYVPLLLLEN